MIRRLLRLFGFATCTGALFGVFALLFGYLAIGVWNLHAPLPKANELAILFAAVTRFMVPGVVGLSFLGLVLAWQYANSIRPGLLFAHSLGSGLALALLLTLEDLPRPFAEWLGVLMPLAPVLFAFLPTRAIANVQRAAPAASD